MAKFNYDLASLVIVEAAYGTDKDAAQKYGISERTIYRYRERMKTDKVLSELVRKKKATFDREWVKDIPPAIKACVDYLKRAAEVADKSDPAVVHAIAGALKILSDVEITKGLLDVRLANLNRAEDEAV